MTGNIRQVLTIIGVSLFCTFISAQTDPGKGSETRETDEFARKKVETKMTEVITTDSMPSSELLNRAIKWMKAESPKYKKVNAASTATKAECLAMFPVKPKELNPEVDYTGKITMKVLIECKDSRFRYTVSEIRHESKSGNTTAGSIDNVVPECGSVAMHEIAWKKLKGEALHYAALVVEDIKEGMKRDEPEVKDDEW